MAELGCIKALVPLPVRSKERLAGQRPESRQTLTTKQSCFWNTSIQAAKYDQPILIHTPHLKDKLQGKRMILDLPDGASRLDKSMI